VQIYSFFSKQQEERTTIFQEITENEGLGSE
jgi:hypothetical protein